MSKILIVEDDLSIQALLHDFIQEAGHSVILASDGVEALAKYSEQSFDLMLLDIMFPKIDGFGVCEVIRQKSDVPIIMLTALDDEENQLKGLDLQADDYITKPFSMPVLLRKIAAVLRRSSKQNDIPQTMNYKDLTLDLEGYKVYTDVISTISPDDENYDFVTTTLSFSSQELYCEHMGEELTFSMPLSKQSMPCDYLDEDGETVYDFSCFVEADVAYFINAPELVTAAERDKALLTFKEEMQNYLNGLSEEEIAGADIKTMLKTKSTELANSLSTENMKLSPCEIYLIEINGGAEEVVQ